MAKLASVVGSAGMVGRHLSRASDAFSMAHQAILSSGNLVRKLACCQSSFLHNGLMAQLADTIGHSIIMIGGQPRHLRNCCPVAAKTVPPPSQRMSDGEWRDSRLLVAPGAFRGTRFVLYVAADAAEMVNASYAWLV